MGAARVRRCNAESHREPLRNLEVPPGASATQRSVVAGARVRRRKAEGVRGALVVDDGVVDDQRPALGQGVIGLAQQSLLLGEIPVVEDVSHDQDVRTRQGIGEEVARIEVQVEERPRIMMRGQHYVGHGKNVLGDPRVALAWLANELRSLGITLRAGEVVTTGTCHAPLPIASGDRMDADFGVLGKVSVGFE